jgi:hypothetical protein
VRFVSGVSLQEFFDWQIAPAPEDAFSTSNHFFHFKRTSQKAVLRLNCSLNQLRVRLAQMFQLAMRY